MFTFILIASLYLVWVKSVMVGSEFSFYRWFKYKGEYLDWYFTREDFKPKERVSK